jgi:gliding motility-associated-like protein
LTIEYAKGCTLTDDITIVIDSASQTVKIPDVFSPNGDGINDFFYIQQNGVSEFEFVVFDRWGGIVYKTDYPDFKWDVIFIDGLHISTQVMRDILNSLNHLSWNGYILLHDCNPPTIQLAREDYYIDGKQQEWNGTVWKAIYWLRANRADLKVQVVDTDWGVGIIKRESSQSVPFDNPFYEYNQMCSNRKRDLGLISIDEFKSTYTSQSNHQIEFNTSISPSGITFKF